MSTEIVVAILSFLTAAGGGLSVIVGKLWVWVDKRVNDCEADREVLHSRIEDMNTELRDISRTVGRLEGKMDNTAKTTEHN